MSRALVVAVVVMVEWWMKVKNFKKMILNSLSMWNNQHSHVVLEFK